MELTSIINQYYDAFMIKYGDTALPDHIKAMNAIRRCRTPDSGELYVQCPNCHEIGFPVFGSIRSREGPL